MVDCSHCSDSSMQSKAEVNFSPLLIHLQALMQWQSKISIDELLHKATQLAMEFPQLVYYDDRHLGEVRYNEQEIVPMVV